MSEEESLIDPKQLPYAVEYAKTGRSACKKCKNLIAEASVRISAREPSRFFDGMQDNWHHFACFWKALRKGDINERSIRGMDWLKWDDQERVRAKIAEHLNLARGADQFGGLVAMDSFKMLRVEYAKTARGKCFACSKLIDKGVIKYGRKTQFFHFECLFLEGKKFDGTAEDIQGFKNLQDTDQETLRDTMLQYCLHPPTPCPSSSKENNFEALVEVEEKKEEVMVVEEEIPEVKIDGCTVVATVAGSKHKMTIAPMEEVTVIEFKKPKMVEEVVVVKTSEEIKKEKLKQQADWLWDLRSGFDKYLSTKQMHELLQSNNQEIPVGKDQVLERLSDCALYGRPLRCPKCPQGQLVFSTSNQTYICTGHMSAWTKCTYSNRNPPRAPMKLDRKLVEGVAWLDEAPFNRSTERVYAETGGQIVSPSKSFRHLGAGRVSLGGVEEGQKKTNSQHGVAKSYIKNGTAVDAEFEYADVTHVLREEDGTQYTVSLCSADLMANRNSYYKIQLLKHDTRKQYYLFRSWGRVGTDRGGQKTDNYTDRDRAIEGFKNLFHEKTDNLWSDRKFFKKKAGYLCLVETDYSELDNQKDEDIPPGSRTTLPGPIVEILRMIFDVENMKSALKDYQIDTERMPLGKLSRNQIMKAYSVLNELQDLMQKPGRINRDACLDATNRFYTLIPHNFGMKAPPLLDDTKTLQQKSGMLDSLLEIEFAYGVLKEEVQSKVNKNRDPVDVHYEKLKTKMEVVDKSSAEYKLIEEYTKNTHGHTHNLYHLQLIDVIRIDREGEGAKFKKDVGNRKLLWHGSGKANYAGILSQGLRIAPPEAPATGYMFGKGVYFADMVSKSANYCRIAQRNEDGLLLLADVALGTMKEELHSIGHNAASIKRSNAHSCKGVGLSIPDPADIYHHPDGYMVPKGKSVNNPAVGVAPGQMSLQYNEYIVYDVNQIQLRYLIRARFCYKA